MMVKSDSLHMSAPTALLIVNRKDLTTASKPKTKLINQQTGAVNNTFHIDMITQHDTLTAGKS